jgi:NAD-dependent SIR2 family protein deacetylase
MGLMGDSRVPETAKWALWTKHMHNMRWAFEPNDGYSTLLDMVKDKDYFVLTSNVDGCFERTGFEKERTYTPQGEWTYYQCMTPCRRDAVFESRPMLDKLLPYISEDGHIPGYMIPKCPHCGGEVFGNVRAGNQFLHGKYEQQNEKIRDWMRNQIESNRTVAVIEIGAGFSTPTVTRFPVEAFARDLGKRGRMIRINPSDPEVPDDLDRAVSLAEGWQILADIQSAAIFKDAGREADVLAHQNEEGMKTNHRHLDFARHMKWNTFLRRLKD